MTLSDKMFEIDGYFEELIEIKDVKEFIRLLKKECFDIMETNPTLYYLMEQRIDKLAGDELI